MKEITDKTINLVNVHIESSTFCNASCFMCPHKVMTHHGRMDLGLFQKIVDNAKRLGVQIVTPFRMGEPFAFNDLYLWLDYIKALRLRIDLFTNGSFLSKEHALRLESYMPYAELTISFMGYDKPSYEANTGLSFDHTVSCIKDFMEGIGNLPVIIYHLLSPQELGFHEQFVGLWDKYKFRGMRYSWYSDWAGQYKTKKTLPSIYDPETHKKVPCVYMTEHLDILYNGKVCLCCMDYDGSVIFGDLNHQTIEEVIYGDLYRHYYQSHILGNYGDLELCSNCSVNTKEK